MFSIRLCMILVCLFLACYILLLVKRGKLQLKYSLLWLAMSLIVLVCAVFPNFIFSLAHLAGFQVGSNFLFFIGLVFLIVISLSLTSIVSRQQSAIKNLTQRIAILENEFMDDCAKKDDNA